MSNEIPFNKFSKENGTSKITGLSDQKILTGAKGSGQNFQEPPLQDASTQKGGHDPKGGPDRISQLPDEVINQIAAGEVVERPAHLVKELVENSLDAQADSITIEIFNGGRQIRVIDNGKGIAASDLLKAMDRHATSKIKNTDDLWKLRSFGFRGEALASISAVSRLTLMSRPYGQEFAHQITSHFGKVGQIEEVSAAPGTSVFIESLFENVPARLKFLKSDGAEVSRIKMTMKALALANPGVEFRIYQEQKLIHYWPRSSQKERAENILEVPIFLAEGELENVSVKVFFADPHHVQKTSKDIWLFAQSRWIQDRSIQTAIQEAYRNLLMHGEFPMAVAFVNVPEDQIDVNIHPTKSQVKFMNNSDVFRAVQKTLRTHLEKGPWIPQKSSLSTNIEDSNSHTRVEQALFNFSENQIQYPTKDYSFHQRNSFLKESQNPWRGPSSIKSENDLKGSDFLSDENSQSEKEHLGRGQEKFEDSIFENQNLISSKSKNLSEGELFDEGGRSEKPQFLLQADKQESSSGYWGSLQVIGQINLTYIVTQDQKALVLVDQHAAHERVMFERLMRAWIDKKIEVQNFLFPLAIDLNTEKVEALMTEHDNFLRFGVKMEPLGPETIGITSAPLFLKETALQNVIEKTAHEMIEMGGSFAMEKKIGDIFSTFACHSAVRAGQSLSLEEMKSLLRQMDEFPLSSFCPHGRPVNVTQPFTELEKSFGRIVT